MPPYKNVRLSDEHNRFLLYFDEKTHIDTESRACGVYATPQNLCSLFTCRSIRGYFHAPHQTRIVRRIVPNVMSSHLVVCWCLVAVRHRSVYSPPISLLTAECLLDVGRIWQIRTRQKCFLFTSCFQSESKIYLDAKTAIDGSILLFWTAGCRDKKSIQGSAFCIIMKICSVTHVMKLVCRSQKKTD